MPGAAVATAAGMCCLLCQQHTMWEAQLHTRAEVCCCFSNTTNNLTENQSRCYVLVQAFNLQAYGCNQHSRRKLLSGMRAALAGAAG
jgi:hypothetical protein